MIRRPPRSTRTDTLFPYTTRFRSGEVPNCGPCLQAWSEDRLEPNWAPKEAAGCGGTMCHTPTCSDCFPKDIWGLNPTTIIHDDVEPLPENPKAIYGRAKPSLALFPAGALIARKSTRLNSSH